MKKSFYQQQDELRELRELLKGKELKIRQLEYENTSLKKSSGTIQMADDIINRSVDSSGMVAEDTDCSDASSDQEIPHQNEAGAEEIEAC